MQGDNECAVCHKKFGSKKYLNRHLWQVHDIGEGKTFTCTVDGCGYTCKRKEHVNQHLWQVHDIGKGKTFTCTVDGCGYTCKKKDHLNRHLWEVHDLGEGKTFTCAVDGCMYTCKRKDHLDRHRSNVHDIGDKECQVCAKNVCSISEFIDPRSKSKLYACRKCYRKIFGYSTRVEKRMVEFLVKDDRIKPYVVVQDKILKGNECSTRCRPDLLLGTPGFTIFVECDEKQHSHYESSCETARMNRLFDEVSGTRSVFIRWNPDPCLKDGKRYSMTLTKRLQALTDLIVKIATDPEPELVLVYYMYYSSDNSVITVDLPRKLLY